MIKKKIFLLWILSNLLFGYTRIQAQSNNSFQGINYQAILKNVNGSYINPVFPFDVRFSVLRSNSSQLLYQETQQVSLLNKGMFNLVIGQGILTGAGMYNRIDAIDQFIDSLFLKVELNINGSGYQIFENRAFNTVAFAEFSKYSLDTIKTPDLLDVTSPLFTNGVLKWNGASWVCMNDMTSVDSVIYAQNAANILHTDTAFYSYTNQHINSDSAIYSHHSGTSNYSLNSFNANTSDTVQYSNIVGTADSVIYAWHLKGNSNLPQFILGTGDTVSFKFKTNNLERFQVSKQGNIYFGASNSPANLVLNSNNGFLFLANSNTSIWNDNSVPGAKFLFCANKAAWMSGMVSDSRWQDTTQIGYASFGFGRDIVSDGTYCSIVFGDSSEVRVVPPPSTYPTMYTYTSGKNAFAFGKKARAYGENSVAVGYDTEAGMIRNVAMGYKCKAGLQSANIALGYQATATGSTAAAFGYNVWASGHKSTVFGSYASTNGMSGSFIYGDASTTDTVKNTALNQFMVRASGGTVLYTDTALAAGVQLFPGSGAWSSLSDSTKKNNFLLLNNESYFKQFRSMNVYSWNYKSQDVSIRHMGPTAQSFYRLYKFGENNTSINLVDADGLNLQMIKVISAEFEQAQNAFNNKLPVLKAELNNSFEYDELYRQMDRIKKIVKSIENE